MFGAVSRSATRHNLATFGDKALERADVLIIDREGLVRAKTADLPPSAARTTTHSAASLATPTAAFATIAIGARATTTTAMLMRIAPAMISSLFVSHCLISQ